MSKIILIFLLVLFSFFSLETNEFKDCSGVVNNNPIFTGEPTFLRQVSNGKLYEIGDPKLNSSWYIAHLYGSEYEMGEALGQLLKDDMYDFFTTFWEDFVDWVIEHFGSSLSKEIKEILEKYGANFLLDLIYEQTKDDTPQYFFDHMKGIAAGCGAEYENVRRFNYIPSLVNSACTIIGADGSSTPSGKLIQIRTLDEGEPDYQPGGICPLMKIPTFQVLHYDDDDDDSSTTVVNINTAGFVGALSGVSSNFLSLSQKWWPTIDTFDPFRKGMPWHFMLFDGLRNTKTSEEYLSFVENTRRTTSSFIGIGDGKKNNKPFYGAKFTFNDLQVLTWENQSIYAEHPKLKDTLYWDKYIQPTTNSCMSGLLETFHGNYTAENFVKTILSLGQTGDSMSVIYDYSDDHVYASFGMFDASYNKQYVKVSLKDLLDEKRHEKVSSIRKRKKYL